jgi:hypothetical protein
LINYITIAYIAADTTILQSIFFGEDINTKEVINDKTITNLMLTANVASHLLTGKQVTLFGFTGFYF